MPKKKNHTFSRKSARIKAINAKLKESYEEIPHNAADLDGKFSGKDDNFAKKSMGSPSLLEHPSPSLLEEDEFSTNSSLEFKLANEFECNMGLQNSSPSSGALEEFASAPTWIVDKKIKEVELELANSPSRIGLGNYLEERYNISTMELVKSLGRQAKHNMHGKAGGSSFPLALELNESPSMAAKNAMNCQTPTSTKDRLEEAASMAAERVGFPCKFFLTRAVHAKATSPEKKTVDSVI